MIYFNSRVRSFLVSVRASALEFSSKRCADGRKSRPCQASDSQPPKKLRSLRPQRRRVPPPGKPPFSRMPGPRPLHRHSRDRTSQAQGQAAARSEIPFALSSASSARDPIRSTLHSRNPLPSALRLPRTTIKNAPIPDRLLVGKARPVIFPQKTTLPGRTGTF